MRGRRGGRRGSEKSAVKLGDEILRLSSLNRRTERMQEKEKGGEWKGREKREKGGDRQGREDKEGEEEEARRAQSKWGRRRSCS